MNKFIYALLILITFNFTVSGQLYNASFETDTDPGKINVVLKISFDVADGLGSSNFQINYNIADLANPILHSTPLSAASYNQLNVTQPAPGLASFNVLYTAGQPPYAIPQTASGDVIVAIIQFDIVSGNPTTNITWNTGTTEIFNAAEVLFYAPGTIQNASGASLPVELNSFSAFKVNDNSAKLNWSTSSEVNFSHFQIERSMDTRNWSFINNVQAIAIEGSGADYAYLDSNINLPRNSRTNVLYRLKMLDKNGDFEYSDVKSVMFEATGKGVEIYPNPTINTINIDSEVEITHISVFNVDGKIMLDQKTNQNILDVSNFNSGVYRMVVTTEDGQFVKPFVKLN